MHPSYFDITVPFFKKNLENLMGLLAKGEALLSAKGISETQLLESRIAPDMLPFVKQIQIATDNAKGACARLAGIEAPVMEDTETTLAELRTRIEKTIAFLNTFTQEQFEGAGERSVSMRYFPGKHFKGHDYIVEYALPNFLFHVTTAYCILRMLGAEIGKADFAGNLSLIND